MSRGVEGVEDAVCGGRTGQDLLDYCFPDFQGNSMTTNMLRFSMLCTTCSLRMLIVLLYQCVSLSLQYGIVLYQNYKIPLQRKTLLSHFSAPVVSVLNSVKAP